MTDIAGLFKRAKMISRNLGVRAGAGCLRNRNVAFEDAYFRLLGDAPRLWERLAS